MNRRERLEIRYIAKMGICGVFIATASVPDVVSIGLDCSTGRPPARRGAAWMRLWCQTRAQAERLLDQFARVAPLGPDPLTFQVAIPPAEAILRECAAELGITLTGNATIIERSEASVARLDQRIEAMRKSGELKTTNQRYKAYRLEQLRLGNGPMSYNEFVDAGLEVVMEAIALEVFGVRAA